MGLTCLKEKRITTMLKSKEILIVDDEPAMVQLTSKKLVWLGYRVTGTLNPKEALDLVRVDPERFDLMITDMVMPDLNGVQLTKLVLEVQPELPIILCSGYCTLSLDEANEIGIKKFLMKPVDLNVLAKEVCDVLFGGVVVGV